MFEKLDSDVKIHTNSTANHEIILDHVSGDVMKTVIIRTSYDRPGKPNCDPVVEWWMFQSSHLTDDNLETNVDCIRLEEIMLDILGLTDIGTLT